MRGRAVLTAALTAGLTLTGAVAVGAGAADAATINQVVIRVSAEHMTFSTGNTIRPGTYTFKVVSADGKDHTVQILRLHRGYTKQQAMTDVNKAFSGDVAAVRRVDTRITWRGGAEAHRSPGWFATTLFPTQYWVVDQNGNAARRLFVTGQSRGGSRPPASGQLTAFSYGFGTSGRLPANGWVKLYNQSDQPHFFVFQHVRQGTTDRQVRQFLASGSQANPPWALRSNTSSAVMSPTTGETMHLALPAGEYMVACWWPDDDTGMPHALMGMWKLIQLR